MKKKEVPRLLASVALILLCLAFLFISLGLSYDVNLIILGIICFGSSPVLFIMAGILGSKWKQEMEEIQGIKWLYIIIPDILLIVIISLFVDIFIGIFLIIGSLIFYVITFLIMRQKNREKSD